MARGGAAGRPGLSQTSASGAAAIALCSSAGARTCTRDKTRGPTGRELRPPSPRRPPSALRRPPPQPVMLEHLSSLPTQMIVGFIYGYVAEQFGWTVYIVMAGFAFSCLLTLPPWPIYRRHPLKWLPVQDSGTEDKKPGERKIKRHAKNN
ncbi:hypothetical protein HPG69_008117 [Diceros bicornis minor]|uniref:Signal peptidase complex subunit 1 n=1 Tax=Diceros bicornis minor TaxID=77932 RepID=A0A7J7F3Y2_DICBM|nr:hypothetical protein HPG69_008117 [Diceros bicornis minor]